MSKIDSNSLGNRLPSENERDAASQLHQVLCAHTRSDGSSRLKIAELSVESDQTEIELTPALTQYLLELFNHISKGDIVKLTPVSQLLTIEQAADILNIPHRYFSGLLTSKVLQHESVGRHRRVKATDVFEYKNSRDVERASALDSLALLDSDSI
ncbi:MAG: excisionase family DNA-binding protein [Gammaproteobacteria bacterium]